MHAYGSLDRIDIEMTLREAQSCTHPGRCDDDVAALIRTPKIRRRVAKWADADMIAELKEFGAWDDDELSIREDNIARLVWAFAGDIVEEHREGQKRH